MEPLTTRELTRLADYNSECSRGLVHTASYDREMAALQKRFDAYPPALGGMIAMLASEHSR